MKKKKTIIVGITGGTGAGKSLFCEFLKEFGASVIDVDGFAKQLMNESENIKNILQLNFGNSIFDNSGKINSKILSSFIFQKQENLKKLNKIVWPELINCLINEIKNFRKNGNGMLAVDIAILFEAKIAYLFDFIVVVGASIETRLHRLKKNRGWSNSRIEALLNAQIEQYKKIEAADYIVLNEDSPVDLKFQASELYDELMSNIK